MAKANSGSISTKILVKSSFWYSVSNFLTRAMSFITIPIFTRLMTKGEYGDFSVFAGWQSIFLIICGVEIYATINRARFDYQGKKLDSYITACLLLSTVITSVFFVMYLIFPNFFDHLFLLDRKYIYIMFAYLYAQPAFQMFQAKQRIEYRYKLSAAISFAMIIGATLLGVGLVYLLDHDRLLGRIIGQYIPYVAIGLVFYIYFLKKSITPLKGAWKYALTLGIPLVFSFLGSQILLTADRVVVKQLGAEEEVAWLVLAASCTHIILIFVQTLNNAWAPWFYDKLKIKEYTDIRKTFSIYMWLIVICTFCVLLVGPEVVLVLGGKGYKQSVAILPANMLCGIFTALSSQFVNLETYHKKTHYAAILTLVVAIFNVAGDVIGVMLFGYQAACYVTVICQLILVCMHYIVTRKMEVTKILSVRNMLLILGVSVGFIPVSLLMYQNMWVRFSFIVFIIIAFLVTIVIKRDALRRMLKKFK